MNDKLNLEKVYAIEELSTVVKDGIDYFMDFRIEEMKSDDQYYLQHIIKYIEYLEFKIDIKNQALNKYE